jgi:hypothetical protein
VSPSAAEPSPPLRQLLLRQVRERQMLDTAVAVFSWRGFHLTPMDEIAEVSRAAS